MDIYSRKMHIQKSRKIGFGRVLGSIWVGFVRGWGPLLGRSWTLWEALGADLRALGGSWGALGRSWLRLNVFLSIFNGLGA